MVKERPEGWVTIIGSPITFPPKNWVASILLARPKPDILPAIDSTPVPKPVKHPTGFKCVQCGNCCTKYFEAYNDGDAIDNDILIWESKKRFDILQWIEPTFLKFWTDQRTDFHDHGPYYIEYRVNLNRCPFLRYRTVNKKVKYYCKIQNIKPWYCRQYPFDKQHAINHECQGFNH